MFAVTSTDDRAGPAERRCVRETQPREDVSITAVEPARRKSGLIGRREVDTQVLQVGEDGLTRQTLLNEILERPGEDERFAFEVEGHQVILGGARSWMRLPAESKIQGKPLADAVVVLQIEAELLQAAVVERRISALAVAA